MFVVASLLCITVLLFQQPSGTKIVAMFRKSQTNTNRLPPFLRLIFLSFFDSITVGTVEKCFVRDVSTNSVPFLDITQTIVFLFASNATKSSRNLNEIPRVIARASGRF